MKISKMTFSATIPTQQYGNIQPSIEFELDGRDDVLLVRNDGIAYIKDLYARFSSIGELKENKIKTSTDKINDLKL